MGARPRPRLRPRLRSAARLRPPRHPRPARPHSRQSLNRARAHHPAKKKPTWETLPDHLAEFNKQVNQIRWRIEQTIAQLKTLRIFRTDYRRPHHTHPQTTAAALALRFLKTSFL
ncbi:MAG: transposase [Bifidobacteriaceae bacterium]|nr:transposase [Bifidobacteriaceae bacterium]